MAKGKAWQGMGFQGEDPLTDFRAGGVLALENIVFFAEKYPVTVRRMIENREMKMSDDGTFMRNYPWSAAGVNITHAAMELFGIAVGPQKKPTKLKSRPKRYWDLAMDFPEVYCFAFKLMDDKYTEMKATYLSFNKVMDATKVELNEILKHTIVQNVFKTAKNPMKLLVTERKTKMSSQALPTLDVKGPARSGSNSPSRSPIAKARLAGSLKSKLSQGSGKPTPQMIKNMLAIHRAVVRGRALVNFEAKRAASVQQQQSGGNSAVGSLLSLRSQGSAKAPPPLPSPMTDDEDSTDSDGDVAAPAPARPSRMSSRRPSHTPSRSATARGSLSRKTATGAAQPLRIAKALFTFEPQAEGDLRLAEGALIIVSYVEKGGWWEGESKDGVGRFPGNYVEEIKTDRFLALSAYDATSETEVSMAEGDEIKLTDADASGWWKGVVTRTGAEGWFPAAFVTPQYSDAAGVVGGRAISEGGPAAAQDSYASMSAAVD